MCYRHNLQTRRWAANKVGLKDRYDQLVNRLLRGRQEGQIGHVSSIIRQFRFER
jgi:hypothetical protein